MPGVSTRYLMGGNSSIRKGNGAFTKPRTVLGALSDSAVVIRVPALQLCFLIALISNHSHKMINIQQKSIQLSTSLCKTNFKGLEKEELRCFYRF